MARRTNKIAFTKAYLYEENGEFMIEEVKKDYTETHSLSEWLRSFMGDERLVNISIDEVSNVEGIE